MNDQWIAAAARAAERWTDPSLQRREAAVAQALKADSRFTEEAVAYAVNQHMHQLTSENLRRWLGGRTADQSRTVMLAEEENVPLSGLRDSLAVLLLGHRCRGCLPEASAVLVSAFLEEVQRELKEHLPITFTGTVEETIESADALLARGEDEYLSSLEELCAAGDIAPGRCLLRVRGFSVGLIDGDEDEEARSGLAEDMLLHEGESRRNVALLWAPMNHDPDAYLYTMAQFRELFPPHASTNGSLAMHRAFLEAADQGHAYGDGFLVSRGSPERQRPAHIRWTEYEDLSEVSSYLEEHAERVELLVAEDRLAEKLDVAVPVVPPGEAHRRPLPDPARCSGLVDWLVEIG